MPRRSISCEKLSCRRRISLVVALESPAFAVCFTLLTVAASRSDRRTVVFIAPKATIAFLSLISSISPTTLCPFITTRSPILNVAEAGLSTSTFGTISSVNERIVRRASAVLALSALLSLMVRIAFSIVALAESTIWRASIFACRIISFFSASILDSLASYCDIISSCSFDRRRIFSRLFSQ